MLESGVALGGCFQPNARALLATFASASVGALPKPLDQTDRFGRSLRKVARVEENHVSQLLEQLMPLLLRSLMGDAPRQKWLPPMFRPRRGCSRHGVQYSVDLGP